MIVQFRPLQITDYHLVFGRPGQIPMSQTLEFSSGSTAESLDPRARALRATRLTVYRPVLFRLDLFCPSTRSSHLHDRTE